MSAPLRFRPRPAVSVVLPTYNRAGILAEAVESVVEQRFTDWELIVVDDGSHDDTQALLDPYLRRHPAIRSLRHSNRRAALSRNAGIQASFGRFVTFLDSDDRYRPEHLESRMQIMQGNPDVELLSGGFEAPEGARVRDRNNPDRLIDLRRCIVGGTLFGRRELFFSIGGFRDLDYAEDTDLWERAQMSHRTMTITQPESYCYRQGPDSITLTYRQP